MGGFTLVKQHLFIPIVELALPKWPSQSAQSTIDKLCGIIVYLELKANITKAIRLIHSHRTYVTQFKTSGVEQEELAEIFSCVTERKAFLKFTTAVVSLKLDHLKGKEAIVSAVKSGLQQPIT